MLLLFTYFEAYLLSDNFGLHFYEILYDLRPVFHSVLATVLMAFLGLFAPDNQNLGEIALILKVLDCEVDLALVDHDRPLLVVVGHFVLDDV